MTRRSVTRYEILPSAQRRLLPTLAPLCDLGFVLYGGTAIALRIGHRASIDFDFFTDRPLDRAAVLDAIPSLAAATVLQDEPETWTLLTSDDGVKLSFFGGLGFGRVGSPTLTIGGEMLVASLADLLGHKLKVVLQRVEAKDYRDIAALLRHGSRLADGLGAAIALFPTLPPCEAVKALTYFEGGDLAEVSRADRRVLTRAVRGLGKPEASPILSKRLTLV